ncbi:hypothetical protein A3762_08425 [Oleiphilus sp. HI0125]|uniref:Mpo1 family 2-hydroxy fatty acid dioxygenase n=1 Tax=Oleiphilus sp. HI0125 TaxID=1822266 RepID=UPI0007C232A0|nr:Mpo1-like protein [Oleiphilus sp. HI0125]KZZ58134.1 hypothetical protein A3762_08425 [Oleiphilus sp. HI0125]
MKTLTQQLVMYANYHRDPRNILTHFVGIPLIVFAIAALLARPEFALFGLVLAPVYFVVGAACLYYLALDIKLGILMGLVFSMTIYGAQYVASLSTIEWLVWSIGLFVVGWVFQFVGHFYEGKKPAFVDDMTGLLIGPLFVVCEFAFMFGLMKKLKAEVESRAGPVCHQTGPEAKAS